MPPDSDLAAQGGNNSSDFVRKLYKMLEDPAYSSVVRWGNDGDSFVVLENEKFTKTILPKHFKHSNFASFVRQLNKYDFHKVRQNEENGQSPYGPNAWEFKHPEFHQHKKDNLDNIRRKAPAPRKAPQADESFPVNQQLNILSDTLAATQHQIQALQEQYFQVTQINKTLVDEVMILQKTVKAQSQVHNELIAHLSHIDERRRNSRHSAHSSHSSHSGPPAFHGVILPDSADEPAPELRRAREILNNISSDPAVDREFERVNAMYQAGSPPDSATSSSIIFNPPGGGHGIPLTHELLGDMRHLVYPAGQTAGIDPFHADHINNIPYTRPPSNPNAMADLPAQETPPPKEPGGSPWGLRPPRVLLVEDDKICAKIGAKFLSQIECSVDVAHHGSDAVNKVNADPQKYDLIFMDIIMPVFDGVSATACIRMVAPRTPIIAMTSNIRQEDINIYFHWGMNDVLAKPFTKDGMIRILKKHLPYLLKNPPPADSDELMGGPIHAPQPVSTPGYTSSSTMSMGGSLGPAGIATSSAVKYETTPIQSPATTTSWHSPGQMGHAQTSPHMDGGGFLAGAVNGQQMVLTPGGTQRPTFQGGPPPQISNPPIRGMPDMGDDRPGKRQRVYAPQGQFAQ